MEDILASIKRVIAEDGRPAARPARGSRPAEAPPPEPPPEDDVLELQDPVTQERGFVFEKYLAAIDGPSPTQPVAQAKAAPRPPKVASKTASTKARSPRQATKPVQQAANELEVTRPDGRRDGSAKKEERRERKMFRWFGGRDPRAAAWTVGAPR